jgi:hypothetical protein
MHKQDTKKKPRRNLLKDVQIGEVSFVGIGANEGARQTLFKTEDQEAIVKRLFSEVMSDTKANEEAQRLLSDMMDGTGYLKASLVEIMEDPRIERRKDMLRQSVQEFSAAMASMIDNAELAKSLADLGFEKAKGKTERGRKFPASDFAYVPDPDKPSTWKLRLTSTPGGEPDPRIVGAAAAALGPGFRGQRVQIPEDVREKVKARVRAAWLAANQNKGEEDLPEILKQKTKEDQMSKELLEKIQKENEKLQVQIAKANFLAGLNDAEKVHYETLDDDAREQFEKMDAETRAKAVKKAAEAAAAADETFEMDGHVVRKSDVGAGVFAILKSQQERIDKAEATAKAERAERVKKELEEEAEKLFPHLPGTPEEKGIMLKSIRSLPEAQQKTQIDMLKASDAAMAKSFKESGQDGTTDADSPTEKLNKMARDRSAEKGISFEKAYTQVLETKEGADLYSKSVQ